jgi:hypothetical protein
MDLVRRLLAKIPDDRYASAADVRADLARLASSSAAVVVAPSAHGAPAVWKRLAWSASALGLVLVGYLVVTSGLLRPTSGAPRAPTVIRSIAVLPLDNYSGDPNQDYFAEGMTDELTANLATISQLRVISRGSAMQFKGKDRPRRLTLLRSSTWTRSWKVRCLGPATKCGSRRN